MKIAHIVFTMKQKRDAKDVFAEVTTGQNQSTKRLSGNEQIYRLLI